MGSRSVFYAYTHESSTQDAPALRTRGVCVCRVCARACLSVLSADPCPPFFSTTAAGLSFKRGYVFR